MTKEEREAYNAACIQEQTELREKLAAQHGLKQDAKFVQCWWLAWQYGHASGLHEVENFFNELVELIKEGK